MKFSRVEAILVLVGLLGTCNATFECGDISRPGKDYRDSLCYKKKCTDKIQIHIREELIAALNYMHMATIFDEDIVHRPGLAKFFYESASEERQHAMMMLDYLNMRGIPFEEEFKYRGDNESIQTPGSYKDALAIALNLEVKVTKLIQKILEECDHDFHAQDTFTDPIMDEQHEGIRKLQGAIKRLENMLNPFSTAEETSFAEYLFDQQLLKENL